MVEHQQGDTPGSPGLFCPVRGTSEPDRLWCVTNVAEATPDLLSPLCWSVWSRPLEASWLGLMYQFGALTRKEAIPSPDPNDNATAAIYGRQAFNVDAVRAAAARLPGVNADDLERDIMGTVRADAPPARGRPARIPVILLKMPARLLGVHRRLQVTAADMRGWWGREVLQVSTGARAATGTPYERLLSARDQFRRAMGVHVMVRMQFQAVQSALVDAATKAGDPSLASRVLTGQGNVVEVGLADDTWRLAQGEITLETFLAGHGFHGPNEGNVYTRSWREDPGPVLATARSMATRSDLARPAARQEAATREGAAAQAQLLAASPGPARPVLRFVLARARNILANMEVGKSAFLMALDGCRAAARDLGAVLADAGVLADPEDVFFLTLEELDRAQRGKLADGQALVDFRRAAREEYRAMTLPPTFTGMPDPATLVGGGTVTGDDKEGDGVSGAASGGGCVRGRARVVLDPCQAVELEAGDILVCRFTDPSWAPLFTMADALVIDIGGAASHGAVVARELGIPFVIGTGNGTSVIGDGDRIEVDGARNLVRILERAPTGYQS